MKSAKPDVRQQRVDRPAKKRSRQSKSNSNTSPQSLPDGESAAGPVVEQQVSCGKTTTENTDQPPSAPRVLMLTTSFPRWKNDQSGSFVADLATSLQQDQHCRVTVVSPAAAGVPTHDEIDGVDVRRLRYCWPASWQRLAYGAGVPWNLKRSLIAKINVPFLLAAYLWTLVTRARKYDVIHSHWAVLGALGVVTKPIHRRPVVITAHGSDINPRVASRLIRRVSSYAIRHVDAVATPSREFLALCQQVCDKTDHLHFIPNGVGVPERAIVDSWHQKKTSRRETKIITVGRLIAERQHKLLVNAFATLITRYPDLTLTIVGDGPQYANLVDMVDRLGLRQNVHFTGQIPTVDVSKHLLAADLYVSPTLIDNFGTAVVEAAAHGLAVVSTRVGFPAELIKHGETGLLVEAGNESQLVEAINRVICDRATMHEMGRRMRDRFDTFGLSHAMMARHMVDLYCRHAA